MLGRKVCILTIAHKVSHPRIFYKEAKSLAAAGYDVTLIAQHERDETVDGIKIIALPGPWNRFGRFFRLTWRTFRLARKEKASIYQFSDPHLLPLAVLLKWTTGAKLVYDVHEDVRRQILSKFWIPRALRKPVSLLYGLVERISLPFVDGIVLAEDAYSETYGKGRKVAIARNFPPLSWADPAAGVERDREQPFTIGYSGSISEDRAVWELIEAFHILRNNAAENVMLKLFGPFHPESLKERVTERIRAYQMETSVVMPGYIPNDQIAKHLAQCDVGMVVLHPEPNYVHSLGTKLFEYMAVSLPVIASNFPILKDVVEGNQCGITVNPLSSKDIAAAMEHLYKNPTLRRQMGENGRRAMMEKYNWGTESARLLNLYQRLEGKTPTRKNRWPGEH